jgi:hypothetical protein
MDSFREAINLLFRYPRREAALDGWTAGKIAKCKMEIEEEGLGNVHSSAEIPSSKSHPNPPRYI